MRKWFSVAMALVLCLMIASGAMAGTASLSKTNAGLLQSKSLNSVTSRIVQETTNPSMSDFEKAVALYDWLIDHTVYRGSTTNPYSVLRYGEASCGGYASAYKVLLAKAGIQSKIINGRLYTLGHAWNLVRLGGRWYHVDVRMGDHLAESEGRYRRFCMSDEQARLYYSFRKKTKANYYASNYAYRTGQLENSIAYVRDAITARVGAGDKFFILDLTAKDAPSELNDPFNRITVKNALQNLLCAYPNIPDMAKATLTLADNLLLVNAKVPAYRILSLTLTIPADIVVEVAGTDFSAVEPLELGDKIVVTPSYATQQKLYWNSSREKTATVNQSGKVTITGFGTTKVKAATIDGSKRSCYFMVTVKPK